MPTFSQDRVSVLPMYSRSETSLEEIRDAMKDIKPQLDEFVGGWASNENEEMILRQPNVMPPVTTPCIQEAKDGLPEMLIARFYFWDRASAKERRQPNFNEHQSRLLNAIDVAITNTRAGELGILLSTRSRDHIGRKDGALKSLEKILKSQNSGAKIERGQSLLSLESEEIFLWLAVQLRDNPQLAADIRLDKIDGLSSRDIASRSTDLKSGVDFDRPNFLTSVAEKDSLGPIDISFVQHVGEDNNSYNIRLHIDGGFEFRKNGLHLHDQLDRPDYMLETSLSLAYSVIPRINQSFVDDAEDWKVEKDTVINDAMRVLEERYKTLRSFLTEKAESSTV